MFEDKVLRRILNLKVWTQDIDICMEDGESSLPCCLVVSMLAHYSKVLGSIPTVATYLKIKMNKESEYSKEQSQLPRCHVSVRYYATVYQLSLRQLRGGAVTC